MRKILFPFKIVLQKPQFVPITIFLKSCRDDGKRKAANSWNLPIPERKEGLGGAAILVAARTSCHCEKRVLV